MQGQCRPGSSTPRSEAWPTTKVTQVTTHRYEQKSLYAPAFEHDACGIALVADLQGRRSHGLVRQALTALEHLAHRGATGAEVATGDGAGHPRPDAAPVPRRGAGFRPPRPGPLRGRGSCSCPPTATTPPRRERRSRRSRPRRAWPSWVGATSPSSPAAWAPRRSRAMPRMRQVVVASPRRDRRPRGGAGDPLALDRLAFCLRKRVEHEVHGVYVSLAVGPHPRLQGHAHRRTSWASSSPTSPTRPSTAGWRSCTRASRPTRSRRGPSPTPTATWPTTARSTRCGATGTGCGPARPCWRAT